MEFGKIIPIVSNIMFFGWVTWSYILAEKGLDTNSAVTTAIVTQCIASNLGYYSYQGWLKNSRNKYRTDENGVPFEMREEK